MIDPDEIVVEVEAEIDLIVVEIPGEQGPSGSGGVDPDLPELSLIFDNGLV